MRSKWIILWLMAGTLTAFLYSSEIKRISLSELEARAEIVVLGQVVRVEKDGNRDLVTIKAASYLKGQGDSDSYTFSLVSRGGLKDFDPALNEGDTGVFFLKSVDGKGRTEKAYWGSIAVFQKNNYCISE